MRGEQEIFDMIVGIANVDEGIRAAMLCGSRANTEAPRDIYQDYDITYFVTDIKKYYNNLSWIKEKFGEPLLLQLPELNTHPLLTPKNDGHFVYLMIFPDGVRIDLSIEFTPYIDDGEPVIVLLDKDNFLSEINVDKSYFHIKPPSDSDFSDACNEFWWCLNNVVKGIMRDELPYAMEMYNHYVREMLNSMVEWYIGIITDFSVSSGKMGKYFKKYLPPELYLMYEKTYSDSDYEHFRAAVFIMCDLFHTLALAVSDSLGFLYNQQEEDGSRAYMAFCYDE